MKGEVCVALHSVDEVGELYSDGAMMTTEFLLKAHRRGFAYAQVGVHHYDRKAGESTGSDLGVILRAVKDTFVLFKQLWFGETFPRAVQTTFGLVLAMIYYYTGSRYS